MLREAGCAALSRPNEPTDLGIESEDPEAGLNYLPSSAKESSFPDVHQSLSPRPLYKL